MGTLTNFATTELVDHVFKAAYSPSATLYIALCTTTPTAASTGSTIVETDYTSYVRKSFTSSSTFGAAATRKVVQSAQLEFAAATGAGSLDINSWAILDASSAGNCLAFGSFSSAFPIASGNTPRIAASEIEISIGATTDGGFSDYTVHKMLDLMFRNQAWTSPNGTIHFALSTATLSDSSTSGTEPSGNGYAREPVANTLFNAASAGVTTNNDTITFDTPSGSWGTIVSMMVMDALTSGNLLAYDNGNVDDQAVTTDDTVQFASGAFDVDLD